MEVMKFTATERLDDDLLESVAVGLSPGPGLVCCVQCRMSAAMKFVKRFFTSSITRLSIAKEKITCIVLPYPLYSVVYMYSISITVYTWFALHIFSLSLYY